VERKEQPMAGDWLGEPPPSLWLQPKTEEGLPGPRRSHGQEHKTSQGCIRCLVLAETALDFSRIGPQRR